jgi:hypothetical protein
MGGRPPGKLVIPAKQSENLYHSGETTLRGGDSSAPGAYPESTPFQKGGGKEFCLSYTAYLFEARSILRRAYPE